MRFSLMASARRSRKMCIRSSRYLSLPIFSCVFLLRLVETATPAPAVNESCWTEKASELGNCLYDRQSSSWQGNWSKRKTDGPRLCLLVASRTKRRGPSDCTNKQGRFEITSVAPGQYVLVARINPHSLAPSLCCWTNSDGSCC